MQTSQLTAIPGKGATVWLTGLPAAGKTTIALAVQEAIHRSGRLAGVIDGDELRKGLCSDLGFTPEDRTENVRRAAAMAAYLSKQGIVTLVALISPMRHQRSSARALHDTNGVPFVEIWVSTPIEICRQRDPKGLYDRYRQGNLHGLTGIDDPYEPPESPDLIIPTDKIPLEESVDSIITLLAKLNIIKLGII